LPASAAGEIDDSRPDEEVTMGHTTTLTAHPVHHPLARAAGIDVAIVFFALCAITTTFFLGNGASAWRNAIGSAVVFVLAAITMALCYAEWRMLKPAVPDSDHKVAGVSELLVAIVAAVVVGPMLLIMPFIFLGAIT
jgi:anti-sigma-K factor RskA